MRTRVRTKVLKITFLALLTLASATSGWAFSTTDPTDTTLQSLEELLKLDFWARIYPIQKDLRKKFPHASDSRLTDRTQIPAEYQPFLDEKAYCYLQMMERIEQRVNEIRNSYESGALRSKVAAPYIQSQIENVFSEEFENFKQELGSALERRLQNEPHLSLVQMVYYMDAWVQSGNGAGSDSTMTTESFVAQLLYKVSARSEITGQPNELAGIAKRSAQRQLKEIARRVASVYERTFRETFGSLTKRFAWKWVGTVLTLADLTLLGNGFNMVLNHLTDASGSDFWGIFSVAGTALVGAAAVVWIPIYSLFFKNRFDFQRVMPILETQVLRWVGQQLKGQGVIRARFLDEGGLIRALTALRDNC